MLVRFWQLLKDRTPYVLAGAITMLLNVLMLIAYGVDLRICATLVLFNTVVLVLALVFEYLQKHRYYERLLQSLTKLDKKYLLPEVVDTPHWEEGKLWFEAYERSAKTMSDEVASMRAEMRAYATYIETWTHEVKTPLAAARLVVHNNPGVPMHDVERQLDKIEAYAEQALFYARSTSVDRDFIIRPVNLRIAVQKALKKYARTLIDAHMAPSLDELDYEVRADEKWLVFMVGQLLVNAAQYRKPGTQSAPLIIKAKKQQVGLDAYATILTVQDEGIGIASEDVTRVFDRGFTGKNGRARARSTGMGLYLVHELACRMDIEVRLTSQVGKGTSVELVFWNQERTEHLAL